MLLNSGVGEDSWESLRLQLKNHWKDWCRSWNSNTLATWCKELTHWKRLWCWERLKEGGEGDDRGWDGWMASLIRWSWVWVSSRSWWWTWKPGVLQSMGLQRVGHEWVTELNTTLTSSHITLRFWFPLLLSKNQKSALNVDTDTIVSFLMKVNPWLFKSLFKC